MRDFVLFYFLGILPTHAKPSIQAKSRSKNLYKPQKIPNGPKKQKKTKITQITKITTVPKTTKMTKRQKYFPNFLDTNPLKSKYTRKKEVCNKIYTLHFCATDFLHFHGLLQADHTDPTRNITPLNGSMRYTTGSCVKAV